jgi:hypothetical protein
MTGLRDLTPREWIALAVILTWATVWLWWHVRAIFRDWDGWM